MSEYLTLATAVARKELVVRYRYFLNTLGSFLMLYILFLLVFFGGREFGVQAVTQSTTGIVVGVFLFAVAQIAFSRIAFDVTDEAQWGTLERLFLTPFGFETILVLKSAVTVVITLVIGGVFLAAMLLVAGVSLSAPPVTVLVVGAGALSSVVGLGFVLGSLAILYKRVENLFNLLQFGFVAVLAAPLDAHPVVQFLPLSFGNHLLGVVIRENRPLWALPPSDLLFLFGHGLAYVLVGVVCVRYVAGVARDRGALSHY